MITLLPAYGRDYKSSGAAKADFFAGKDFILVEYGSPWDGKPVSFDQLMHRPEKAVNIRYSRNTKVTVVKF